MLGRVLMVVVPSFLGVSSVKIVVSCNSIAVQVSSVSCFLGVFSVMIAVLVVVVQVSCFLGVSSVVMFQFLVVSLVLIVGNCLLFS